MFLTLRTLKNAHGSREKINFQKFACTHTPPPPSPIHTNVDQEYPLQTHEVILNHNEQCWVWGFVYLFFKGMCLNFLPAQSEHLDITKIGF